MDQRRMLLAVVLVFLVYFGYNYWAGQRAAERAQLESTDVPASQIVDEGAAQRDGSAEPSTTPGAGAADAGERAAATGDDGTGEAPVIERAPEQFVTVETPLWTAELSTHGASITSWCLAEYDAADGSDVCLVPEGARGLPLEIDVGMGTIDARQRSFSYDGPSRVELAEGSSPRTLTFVSEAADGVRIVREYTFDPSSYAFTTTVEATAPYERGELRSLNIGWPGIEPTEAKEEERAFSSVIMTGEGSADRKNLGNVKDEPRVDAGAIAWATSQSRYFMAAVAPANAAFDAATRFGTEEPSKVGFDASMEVDAGSVRQTFLVYAGPQDYFLLKDLGIGLDSAVEMGWSFTRPLSVLVLRAFVAVNNVIPNYGLVIIIFSIITKVLFLPLTHKSFTSMKRMQDLKPKMDALQQRFKDDKEGLAKAQMELYRKEKVNPLAGCFPMLLQMPVFIALFQVLRNTIELRGAEFALWITDLSQPDTLFAVAGFPIHILPLLMGVGMLVQQRFTSSDPQQAMMSKMMPVLFTALFYGFASGLVLYWSVNTALSIWHQYYIQKSGQQRDENDLELAAVGTTSTTTAPEFGDAGSAPPAGGPGNGNGNGNGSGRSRGKRKK